MLKEDGGKISLTCSCGWTLEAGRRTPWTPGDLYTWYEFHWKLAHKGSA